MLVRSLLAAAAVACSFSAQAALVTIGGDVWPPAGSSGIEGVLFNKVSDLEGQFIALGAHGYKNGPTLPYDAGTNTFSALAGLYEPQRANWSFNFAYDLRECSNCSIKLDIEAFSDAQVNAVTWTSGVIPLGSQVPSFGGDSWNLEMDFLNILFDPYSSSSALFTLTAYRDGQEYLATEINVEVADAVDPPPNGVPEPGTLALMGVALAAVATVRRQKRQH